MSALYARLKSWSGAERAAGLAVALAAAGLMGWAARLWSQWEHNPDLSHGFLAVPAIVMLWMRAREDAPRARGLGGGLACVGVGLGALGLVGAVVLTTAYAVAFGWSAMTLFLLSGATMAALGLAAVLAAGRGVRWIGGVWPVLVMLAVVLLSAPLPPGTYSRLTLGLQEGITVAVVGTLRIMGIPAMRAGNIIDLGVSTVGVEEACSGVRSLISCLLAGLVLSGLLLRSPWRRALLVGLAGPLALVTNFGRSLALTLLAREGVSIEGAWHDGLGYAALGLTTGLLAALAFWLEEKPLPAPSARVVGKTGDGGAEAGKWPKAMNPDGWRAASAVALTALLCAGGWMGYVAARTEAEGVAEGEMPALERLVPAVADGWTVTTREDLGRFTSILRTTHLAERTFTRSEPGGRHTQITVYVAWWGAGAASLSEVASHTPEMCWPGAGWQMLHEESGRRSLMLRDGREAREAEQRAFISNGYPQRVWFWHLVDGAPLAPFNPNSWREQLRMFFKRGVRREQSQAFVRFSSNVGWSEIAGEPLVAEVLGGFAKLGVPLAEGKHAPVAADEPQRPQR